MHQTRRTCKQVCCCIYCCKCEKPEPEEGEEGECENDEIQKNQIEPVIGFEGGVPPPNMYYQQVDMSTNQTQPN